MILLEEIRRNPVKGLGQEVLQSTLLTAGRPIGWDRVWAVTHGNSEFDEENPVWVRSRNHVIQTTSPALAQITCRYDEASGELTLAHPDLGEVTANPVANGQRIADWLAPIAAPSGPPPYRIVSIPGGNLHDFEDTHLSIGNLASLRALEEMAGMTLERIRFRMNLWIDGAAPWEEFDWGGQEIALGDTRLKITGRVKRCNATNADPQTGKRNTDIPKLLHERFGHLDFGLYAQVIQGGEIKIGDRVSP